jgi:superfamily II DNA helicase RecQ
MTSIINNQSITQSNNKTDDEMSMTELLESAKAAVQAHKETLDRYHENVRRMEEMYNEYLFEQLRQERNIFAKELKVKPMSIVRKSTLRKIAKRKPETKEKLLKIKGIKEMEYQQFVDIILQTLKDN